ncbi:type III pantothenate kinase [Peptoniphilus sp. oral taxon 386]|uniref:type III pantothenate kinase n=1 Tax=Peptoniphilus sp. oral taxon 386 TaxID=652713 RepID=UPI0001DAA0DE|nr:type III pantothenate kinase [Peptoniphilus sp. oral taxon 386]EFI41669.1 putative pantothenate kinase, type III [Peptoniphilus sp. oral taxon 386 str. F0131]
MLLAINIENKDTIFGIYNNDELLYKFRIKTDISKSADEIGILYKLLLQDVDISFHNIDGVIISSVVPDMTYNVEKMIKKYCKLEPVIVGVGIKTGLNIKCENPKEVGSDRISNAVAVLNKFRGSAIIINSGSVLTFDVVNEKSDFLGGLIVSGIKIARDAVTTENAKLPKIEIVEPKKVIGNTTVKAMQSGLYYQYVSTIDGIIGYILTELELKPEDVNIVMTGSFSSLLTKDSKYNLIVDNNLTLKGLKIIYEINKKMS